MTRTARLRRSLSVTLLGATTILAVTTRLPAHVLIAMALFGWIAVEALTMEDG